MKNRIFNIKSQQDFEAIALEIYQHQREHCVVYQKYCELLKKDTVRYVRDIPYLPIQFFKSHQVISSIDTIATTFTSSGTTGMITSQHQVTDLDYYHRSLDLSFKHTYGDIKEYAVLALLPHYLERSGSSLVYMAQRWIDQSNHQDSGFYLHNYQELAAVLKRLNAQGQKVILLGVTFALLQLADDFPMELPHTTIIETGGMKGMRKEMIKSELHSILNAAFTSTSSVHRAKAKLNSEYGMTELLSQAYASDALHFTTPPWMKVTARDTNDALSTVDYGKTGGLNIIDLANYNSCSFIATQDLGKVYQDGSFEVLGRFDHSDIRGCNLMVVE